MIMNPDRNFHEKIYNDDIIYHYTKASTAIDYILYNKQLLFNKAVNSSDPIESKRAERSILYNNINLEEYNTIEHHNNVNKLNNKLTDLHQRFTQICFCKNTPSNKCTNEYYLGATDYNDELFGYTKLRMWDQYADRFMGVCIAFSKEKILNLNKQLDLLEGHMEYLNFNGLKHRKVGDIQGDYLEKVGIQKYNEEIEIYLKRSFFYKHIDYSGENEYRIGTLYEDKKCRGEIVRGKIINNSIMLDITGCIEAIFMSNFVNEKQRNELINYANTLNVELIEMEWKHNSFEAIDYKKRRTFYKNLEQKTLKKTDS